MKQTSPEPLLTTADLCQRLGIADRTARAWRTAGRLPKHLMVGRFPRWRASDVDDWIARGVLDAGKPQGRFGSHGRRAA